MLLDFQLLYLLESEQIDREKCEQWPTFSSTQSHGALSLATTHLCFLKGNVIILLINRKSDRPICQEQASAAAAVLPCLRLLGFAKGSLGTG